MNNKDRICQIIDANVLEITRKITGIILTASQPMKVPNTQTLYLCAKGSYQLDLYLHADKDSLKHIACTMKHDSVTEEEIPLYTTEFFNILAGKIISTINQLYKQSARFRPPVFSNVELHPSGEPGESLILHYQYSNDCIGNLSIEGKLVPACSPEK